MEATPTSVPILQAVSLSRRDDATGAWLLRDVSLSVQAGDRLGLAGPSGAGKTLLLRALARLDPLNEGDLLWYGAAVFGSSVPAFRARIIYLHQRPVLMEGTVESNLRLPLTLGNHRQRQFERKCVIAWLEQFGRDESFLDKRNQDLSGGEAQLAGLVRAVQLEPQMLLLDEPTSGLDRDTAARVEEFAAGWLSERPDARAYVWVSHDTRQTDRMCDRVLTINGGRL